jgi:hypothetical protein
LFFWVVGETTVRPSEPLISAPCDGLAVVGVQDEGYAGDLSVPAGELEAVRRPPVVRPDRYDLAVMDALRPVAAMAHQQQAVLGHDPIDALKAGQPRDRSGTRNWDLEAFRQYSGDTDVAGNQDAYERAMDCQALLDDTDHLALDPAGGDTAHGVFGHLIDYESCHLHWAWRPRKMWSETFTSKLPK